MKIHFLASVLVAFFLLTSFPVQSELPDSSVEAPALYQVNINTANAEELSELLAGVGEAKAQAIVAYRNENGGFSTVDDLLLVSGIGIRTLDANRHILITGME